MKKSRDPIYGRAAVVTGLVLLLFTGLIAQLGNLTLRQERQSRAVVVAQSTRSLPVFASRGIIYDRNMEPLVTNRPANSVFVRYPYYNQPEVLQRLSAILQVPMAEIDKLVQDKLASEVYYEPIRLKDDITPPQYAAILERKPELPGVEVQPQPVRVYPLKESAAQVLGYVNQIGRDELVQLEDKGYQPGELFGRTGLEHFYEDVLRGKPGIRQVEINTNNEPIGVVQSVEPQPGNSIVLTLDAKLQAAAERALEWDMWRIRNTIIGDGPWPNAKAGAVVVMEVKTGKILAMVSRPAFDPNMFARGITQKELDKLQDPILTPELNRAIQTAYQPGSTWKMMTATSALENGVVTPDTQVFCNGVYNRLHHPKDWTPYGHGYVNTVKAIQTSCDIYFYEMGYQLTIDRLVATAQEFGFGARTGIDLWGENPGLLPDAENREEIWANQRKDPWGPGHTVSAAIGQIVNVTPLQLARYVATLGNGGKIMRPYLVDKVVDGVGNTVKEFAPQQMGQVNITPEHLQVILQGMAAVNSSTDGSSDYLTYPLPGITTGGKTGTAEYPPMHDYGFFVSLSPLDDPQIAIAVAIEQAGHGGSVGAVNRAIESAYYNVNLTEGDPAKVPAEFPNDIAGLRRKYHVVGSGE